MKLQLVVVFVVFSNVVYAWSKKEIQKNIQDYRGQIKEDFVDLKQKEQNLIRVIKVWKAQNLKELEVDYDRDLRLLNQEFSIKLQALDQVQRFKTPDHQVLVEKTFMRSFELREEKFFKRRDITDDYFTAVSKIEKEFMEKYQNIVREFALRRKSNLNNRYPAFFPEGEVIQKDPWLKEQFCRQQVFYAKEQAKMDHKSDLFEITVPMRKEREEADVRYKLAREELEFYREAFDSMQELSKHISHSADKLADFQKKYNEAQKGFYVAESNLEQIKKKIKEVAFDLKKEKNNLVSSCDISRPIGKIRMKD